MPRKAAERAIALGETDPFEFFLARDLNMTLAELGRMAYDEYVRWRAFYVWENAMADMRRRMPPRG